MHDGRSFSRSPSASGRTGGVFAAAAVAFALAAAPGAGLAAECPGAEVLPRVALETDPGKIVYDTRLGRSELQRLQGRTGAASRRRGWHPIGLTLTELQFHMKISVNTLRQPNGRHCATVGKLDAKLGYDTLTVYVDRHYQRGSCPYRSIIEHENLHVGIFRDTLALYAPKVERRLSDAAQRLKPVSARTAEAAAAKIQKALQREMAPLFKEMNRVLDDANDRIDTADNYRREQAKCSKW